VLKVLPTFSPDQYQFLLFGNSFSPLHFLLQYFFTGIVIVLLKISVL